MCGINETPIGDLLLQTFLQPRTALLKGVIQNSIQAWLYSIHCTLMCAAFQPPSFTKYNRTITKVLNLISLTGVLYQG